MLEAHRSALRQLGILQSLEQELPQTELYGEIRGAVEGAIAGELAGMSTGLAAEAERATGSIASTSHFTCDGLQTAMLAESFFTFGYQMTRPHAWTYQTTACMTSDSWVDLLQEQDPSPDKVIFHVGCNKGYDAALSFDRWDHSPEPFSNEQWAAVVNKALP